MACNVTDGQEDKVIDTRFGAATRTQTGNYCAWGSTHGLSVCVSVTVDVSRTQWRGTRQQLFSSRPVAPRMHGPPARARITAEENYVKPCWQARELRSSLIAKFHYTDTDTGPTRTKSAHVVWYELNSTTRTRTFLWRNSVGSVRVRFVAKKSVFVSV